MNALNSAGTVSLNTDEAVTLTTTLSIVDDWLRRASDEILADLANFLDSATMPGAFRDVADVFIIRLGMLILTLRQRIEQVSR